MATSLNSITNSYQSTYFPHITSTMRINSSAIMAAYFERSSIGSSSSSTALVIVIFLLVLVVEQESIIRSPLTTSNINYSSTSTSNIYSSVIIMVVH